MYSFPIDFLSILCHTEEADNRSETEKEGVPVSFYRYACETEREDGATGYTRSLIPISYEAVTANAFFTYRYYTSESENEQHSTRAYIVSVGYERRSPRRHSIHPYNRFAIHYITKGRGIYRNSPVKAGQLLFVPPYQERNFDSDPEDPLEFYYITVAGEGSEEIITNAGFEHSGSLLNCPYIDRIPPLFRAPLFGKDADSDPGLYLLGFFYQLAALHKNYSIKAQDLPKDKAFFYYKQALAYIEVYLLDGLTPNDIAQYLHISPPYLRKIFAKYSKYSLREYLLRKKIRHAADQLRYSQCTVIAAANSIGYDDYTQFSKIFKKYMGMSPLYYRKTHKNDAAEHASDPADGGDAEATAQETEARN